MPEHKIERIEALQLEYERGMRMPFELPGVSTAADAACIKVPDLEDTPLMIQFEVADELLRDSGKVCYYNL